MGLINFLGGYTESEVDIMKAKHHNQLMKMKKQTFTVGDAVYIQRDKHFNPSTKYYLFESYNNLSTWYVSVNPNSEQRDVMDNGVGYEKISHEKPKHCDYCNRPL